MPKQTAREQAKWDEAKITEWITEQQCDGDSECEAECSTVALEFGGVQVFCVIHAIDFGCNRQATASSLIGLQPVSAHRSQQRCGLFCQE